MELTPTELWMTRPKEDDDDNRTRNMVRKCPPTAHPVEMKRRPMVAGPIRNRPTAGSKMSHEPPLSLLATTIWLPKRPATGYSLVRVRLPFIQADTRPVSGSKASTDAE